jgi:hypothetical protein
MVAALAAVGATVDNEEVPCLCDGSMQVRAKRLVGEVLLPQPRREFGHAGRGVLAHTLQHIDEVRVRIDPVQTAGDDQALNDARVFGADFGPTEEPIFFFMGIRA